MDPTGPHWSYDDDIDDNTNIKHTFNFNNNEEDDDDDTSESDGGIE